MGEGFRFVPSPIPHLPTLVLPSCQERLSATVVPRREKGRARERRKLTDPSMNPERNVELEVICREGVGAGCLRREGVSTAEGGGALEGS